MRRKDKSWIEEYLWRLEVVQTIVVGKHKKATLPVLGFKARATNLPQIATRNTQHTAMRVLKTKEDKRRERERKEER